MSVFKDFSGYREGEDLAKIPVNNLAYPSKNVLVHKGVIYSRPGIKNDGNAHTTDNKVHSEFVWKDAAGGVRPLRFTGQKVQVKYGGLWITIFSGLQSAVTRVRCATWVDSTGSIIKKRLFFVDGSDKIYEWNGAIAEVASYSSQNVTISGSSTLEQIGFDPGNVTPQDVQVVHFSGGAVANITEYATDDSMADGIMHLTSVPSPVPVAGDLLIASVVEHTSTLAGFNKDEIYTYKNHVAVANLSSVRVYFSDQETKLDFSVPGTTTALSAFFLNLDGFFTAMISRKNVLWISTEDDWFKITKLNEMNAYDQWVEIEKVEQAERTGALPFAVANHKGDIIFMAADKTLNRVTTLELVGTDEIKLISDEVEDLFKRLDLETDVRIYYLDRYIWIISPNDSTAVLLDWIAGYFQPPQILPLSCISVIDGTAYGHSNVRDETFELMVGHNDLGTKIESVIAFGYYSHKSDLDLKEYKLFGVSGRTTKSAKATVVHYYEDDGGRAKNTTVIDGNEIKLFKLPDDISFGTHPFGTKPFAGDALPASNMGRFFAFDKHIAIPQFEYRPVFTITGDEAEFHLLSWMIDDKPSSTPIPSELFIPQ
jgi:hypothetical protein